MILLIEVKYSKKSKKYCTSLKEARRKFGDRVANDLISILNLIKSSTSLDVLESIKKLRLHKLENKNGKNRKGQLSITIGNSKWRLILIPYINDIKWNGEGSVNKLYSIVKIVEVKEVVDYHE